MIKRNSIILLISIMFLVGCNQKEIDVLEKQVSDSNNTIESLNEDIKEMESKYQTLNSEFEEVSNELDIALADKLPIEQKYLDEIYNWSGVTSDAVEINDRYRQLWEDEINKYYDLIYKALDDDKKYLIVSSQEKWEESIQIDEELNWQWNYQLYDGGTTSYVLNADASYNMYRDRALSLIRIYGIVNE